MNPGPQIARLLAAMILAIVAWAAPSLAGAHDDRVHAGHGHAGHHRAVSGLADAAPVSVIPADTAALMRPPAVAAFAPAAFAPAAFAPAASASFETASALRSDDSDRGDGRGLHGLCRCGAACCAPGILAASLVLSGPTPRNVVLRAYDTAARTGLGPEAPAEPPRTLA